MAHSADTRALDDISNLPCLDLTDEQDLARYPASTVCGCCWDGHPLSSESRVTGHHEQRPLLDHPLYLLGGELAEAATKCSFTTNRTQSTSKLFKQTGAMPPKSRDLAFLLRCEE